MKFGYKLARYGMNMEEAVIAKWRKAPGESFAAGEILYDIETEKVTQEVEAASAGTLVEIVVSEGQLAAVGDVVCYVEAELSGSAPSPGFARPPEGVQSFLGRPGERPERSQP